MSNEEIRVEKEKLRRTQNANKGGLIHPILGYYYPSARSSNFVKHYEKIILVRPNSFKNLQV